MPPVPISDLTPLLHVPLSLIPFVELEVIPSDSGHPFIKLTIRGSRENDWQRHTICALIDLISQDSSLTNAVRHLDIQYDEGDEKNQNMDPYVDHAGLSKLFRLCTNLQTASIEGFCPSRYRNNYISTLYHSFHSSDPLTELEIFRFKGTDISELCLFLSNFPNLKDIKGLNCDLKDLEALSKSLSSNRGAIPASVDFDNPALAHLVPKDIVAFRQIRSVVFNGKPLGRLVGSDSALMDLLGSSYTLFPRLELLNYRNDDLLVRMQRSLDRLRGSLRTLQLGTGPRGKFKPTDYISLPPLLERFEFLVMISDPSSLPLAGPEFYARTLKNFPAQRLKSVKITMFVNDNSGVWGKHGELCTLDDALSSDRLGLERFDAEVTITTSPGSGARANWERWFWRKGFPKVYERFLGSESRRNGRTGELHLIEEAS